MGELCSVVLGFVFARVLLGLLRWRSLAGSARGSWRCLLDWLGAVPCQAKGTWGHHLACPVGVLLDGLCPNCVPWACHREAMKRFWGQPASKPLELFGPHVDVGRVDQVPAGLSEPEIHAPDVLAVCIQPLRRGDFQEQEGSLHAPIDTEPRVEVWRAWKLFPSPLPICVEDMAWESQLAEKPHPVWSVYREVDVWNGSGDYQLPNRRQLVWGRLCLRSRHVPVFRFVVLEQGLHLRWRQWDYLRIERLVYHCAHLQLPSRGPEWAGWRGCRSNWPRCRCGWTGSVRSTSSPKTAAPAEHLQPGFVEGCEVAFGRITSTGRWCSMPSQHRNHPIPGGPVNEHDVPDQRRPSQGCSKGRANISRHSCPIEDFIQRVHRLELCLWRIHGGRRVPPAERGLGAYWAWLLPWLWDAKLRSVAGGFGSCWRLTRTLWRFRTKRTALSTTWIQRSPVVVRAAGWDLAARDFQAHQEANEIPVSNPKKYTPRRKVSPEISHSTPSESGALMCRPLPPAGAKMEEILSQNGTNAIGCWTLHLPRSCTSIVMLTTTLWHSKNKNT